MIIAPLRALTYIGIGVTGEVIYTAIRRLIQKKDWRLQGYTQLWVMPLYALGGVFIFERLYQLIHLYNIAIRFCLYAILIFVIEYLAGFTVKQIIGKCPWKYKGKGSVHGYIDLYHFPAWGAVGLIFEIIYRFLINH